MLLAIFLVALAVSPRADYRQSEINKMVGKIFESIKINQQNLQFDSIRRELEILSQLDASSSNRFAELMSEIGLISSINELEDSKLVEEYGKLLSKVISELQNGYDICEKKDLKSEICQGLLKAKQMYKVYALTPRFMLLQRMGDRILQTTDVIEQQEIATNFYALLSDIVKNFWNVLERIHYQIIMSFTYTALELITNKHLYNSEDKLINSSGNLILPIYREAVKDFVKTVLSAQEEIINQVFFSKESEELLPEHRESIEKKAEYQYEEVNAIIVSESIETEKERLKDTFDLPRKLTEYPDWDREAQRQKNKAAMEWARTRLEKIDSKQNN